MPYFNDLVPKRRSKGRDFSSLRGEINPCFGRKVIANDQAAASTIADDSFNNFLRTLENCRKLVASPYHNDFTKNSRSVLSEPLPSNVKGESAESGTNNWKSEIDIHSALNYKESKNNIAHAIEDTKYINPATMFMAQSRISTGPHEGMIPSGLNNSYSSSGHFGNPAYFMGQPSATQSMYSYPDTSCRMAVSATELSQNFNRTAMAYQNDLRLNYHNPNSDFGSNFTNGNTGSCYNSHCNTDMRMNYGSPTGNSVVDSHAMNINYAGQMNSSYHEGSSHSNNVLYHPPQQNSKSDCSSDVFAKPTTFGEHCSSGARHKHDTTAPVMPTNQDAITVKTEMVRNHCSYSTSSVNNGVYNGPDQQQMFMGNIPSPICVSKDDCFRPRILPSASSTYPNSTTIPSANPGVQHSTQSHQFTDTSRQPCFRVGSQNGPSNLIPSANGSYEPLTPPPSEPNTSPPLDGLPRKTPPPPYPANFTGSKSHDISHQPKFNRRNNPELEKRRTHYCNFAGMSKC